ncbi:MAG: N-acetylmannosamine-6-phosphate 2-epimerase [Lachnospiraceae bacterium]|nr:N-acetylmannosamine-6-phosphate 2-epimerase [Lachnospiraceae bacterium]
MKDIKCLKGKLIVSCQALPDEPLYSSYIMGRMAQAAQEGGAAGIRANTPEDIREIQSRVDLPIIGIIKQHYEGSEVYITPTLAEVDRLKAVNPEIIAIDATQSLRPSGITLENFVTQIREKYPGQMLMADCSTVEEAIHADEIGFDFIGTTLVGYTRQSRGDDLSKNDFAILREILKSVKHRVIAEGKINTPQKARKVLEMGAFSVVVGSVITRPQYITRTFVEEIEREADL